MRISIYDKSFWYGFILVFVLVLAAMMQLSGCGEASTDAYRTSGSANSDADADADVDGNENAEGVALDTANTADSEAISPQDTGDTAVDLPDTADSDSDAAPVCDPTRQITYWLSADDSNSMASPVIARNQITGGNWVSTAIRPWEFLNYYRFAYPAAPAGSVNVFSDLRVASETENGAYSMQIAVSAPAVTNLTRRPMNIVLATDTSGSMDGGPMDRLRQVCRGIAANLRDGDMISIVEWDVESAVVLDSYRVVSPNDPALLSVINKLNAGGGTNLYGGLQNAYRMAQKNFDANRINRVVLISDGQANAGTTELSLISQMSEDSSSEGIFLAGVGTGDGYNDTLMNSVTDAGKGAYIFVDTLAEADRMFAEESNFIANMEVAARDVQVSVTMPQGFYVQEFHGEEISTNKAEVDPQHLAYNDAMIFHQIINTCGTLSTSGSEQFTVTATFKDPISRQPKTVSQIFTLAEMLNGTTAQMIKGDAIIAYALALEQIQLLYYQQSDYPAIVQLIDNTLVQVDSAAAALGNDPELLEISALLTAYRAVFRY